MRGVIERKTRNRYHKVIQDARSVVAKVVKSKGPKINSRAYAEGCPKGKKLQKDPLIG